MEKGTLPIDYKLCTFLILICTVECYTYHLKLIHVIINEPLMYLCLETLIFITIYYLAVIAGLLYFNFLDGHVINADISLTKHN
jgi:hypothetical protein